MAKSLIESQFYVADPTAKPFVLDFRQDVTAADIETAAAGVFVICRVAPPSNQMFLIKSMVFYAMERTNVGLVTESAQFIDPAVSNGFFSFQPLVGRNSPFIVELDFNAPRIAAAPLNADRTRTKGISYTSMDPWRDTQTAWFNPMFTILVPTSEEFSVNFSLLRNGAAPNGLPNTYTIGAPGPKRVDFAGVMIAGIQMTEQAYRDVVEELNRRVDHAGAMAGGLR